MGIQNCVYDYSGCLEAKVCSIYVGLSTADTKEKLQIQNPLNGNGAGMEH